ncbi:hypothetical protein K437DRAFT_263658 [Tilletiaria anomala UBC 951]|uniref:Uncharacterized protein n=1 Tax=Tilletiaria anomala (strain ATCC 24038 / CBS 436.72 / UBC 951) TaxID=1037660 RepID=A0A066VWF8_TILAU|nr:uncharacterized protein K437DRAFT_263658 [Tilletiaria anomala UBC 951]KDN42840.1 hypothetical protein K437DRAFT_263658 [Tilletiaria anomala UBC 951]
MQHYSGKNFANVAKPARQLAASYSASILCMVNIFAPPRRSNTAVTNKINDSAFMKLTNDDIMKAASKGDYESHCVKTDKGNDVSIYLNTALEFQDARWDFNIVSEVRFGEVAG